MTERRCLQHSPQLMMQEDAEIKGSRSFWCMSRSHMWKCEDVNLPVRWPFSPVFSCWLDCLFASEKKKKVFCSDLNKKCLDQSCFILKCCYFIALWKHPVLAIKTRCWNVTLLSVEVGISRTQSSMRKCIPSRNTVRNWTRQNQNPQLYYLQNTLIGKYLFFFIIHLLLLQSEFVLWLLILK